jgi:cell division protein FtsW (lipid II flippase)
VPSARGKETALLGAGAAVVLLGLALVYLAVTRPFAEVPGRISSGEIVDLSTLSQPEQLVPLLGFLDDSAERAFVAGKIQRRVSELGGSVPNVGELAKIRVPAAEIESASRLPALQERLEAARERRPDAVDLTVPLLSEGQFRQLKPRLVARTPGAFRFQFWLWTGLALAGLLAVHLVWRVRRFTGDQAILPIVLVLTGLGLLVMTSVRDPLRDQLLFREFAQGALLGCVALLAGSLIDTERSPLRRMTFPPLGAAVLLSVLLILFGSGPGSSDAKVNLFGFQPVELVKILVVLFLAGWFVERWEFLRELSEKRVGLARLPGWLRLPKAEYALPPALALGVVLFFFFLQRDLGPALVLSFLFLALYSVARGRPAAALAGTALVALAFFVGYRLGYPRTVTGRIQMWLSPWDNDFSGGGHLAQSLWALAGGAATGTGLGLGQPGSVPAVHTDMVLAALGEELGFVGLLAVFALYVLLLQRGLRAALRAGGTYSFFLALGLTLLLALPVVLIAGGVVGLLPLSGVVTPFVSYGKTALVANSLIVGLLLAVSAGGTRSGSPEVQRRFARPVRWVAICLVTALGLIVLRAAQVQLLQPDEFLARGTLTPQGDGQRRFDYNPRLEAIAATIPRGSIVDRNGIPLALSSANLLDKYRADLEKLGGQLGADVEADANGVIPRVYPFGARTFHLLGDLRTRVHWAASNTSYAERDSRIRLQGYDDYSAVVDVRQPDGTVTPQVQLDYTELIPLLRHRYQPEHPEVKKILARDRTLRMSIDVRLQLLAGEVLKKYAAGAGHGAAAVVLDATTGDLLASASYPWPESLPVDDGSEDGVIDRARYGIYPPGSTFKLVTAMTALAKDPAIAEKTFECKHLSDGRVGNRVRGWGRPIRDDPTVETPHGNVDLERGISQSCNAYFAQLATYEVGAEPLLTTARRMGITMARPNTAEQLKDALPQASYGQGQVVATPFQMARVAATVANRGAMPEGRWVIDESNTRKSPPEPILGGPPLERIARSMRRVVTNGTASRILGGVEPAIAGKTGTAEVQGKRSHSWFIGYAPYGGKGRRIAFAVIVEHGGYGGRLAAQAAGEIVREAARLGLIE